MGDKQSRLGFRFEAELWRWQAKTGTAWIFATLPWDVSEDVRDTGDVLGPRQGFGSVRVEVSIGETMWHTSVFPDKSTGCYVLPIKKAVRAAEDLEVGDLVSVEVRTV